MIDKKWFVLYFISNIFSRFGENIYALALAFIVLEKGESITTFASVFAVEYLPYIIIGPFIGNLLDNMNRRLLLVLSDSLRLVLLLIIPLLDIFDFFRIGVIYVVAFMITTVIMVNRILSEHSILPYLVEKEQLNKINAYYTGTIQIAQAMGQILSGTMIGLWGASFTLLFNSFLYVIPILVFLFIPIKFPNYKNKKGNSEKGVLLDYLSELKEGLTLLRTNKTLLEVTSINWFTNLARASFYTFLFYYLASENNLSSIYIGVIYSAVILLGIISSVIAPRIINKYEDFKLRLYSFMVILASFTFIGMFFVPWYFVIVLFFIEFMLTNIRSMIGLKIRQIEIPDNLIGRTNGFINCIIAISYPLSALLFGFVGDLWGTKFVFLFMGIIHFVVGSLYAYKHYIHTPNKVKRIENTQTH
ncbi:MULTISPECIES: MFS transporter [Geobacillus]|uniref:MFS transporter n=1 Tax=Geobacillus thermocatenulatus TaxID=33938 RepID=A0A226Q2A8_9BACL|nr:MULTISPECIES: MFS transporter [Geobacillus]ASS99516.1 hypothetical protein GT3921_11045 [Geobacillus thermocatenulatus]KLR73029.1 hypothetical protein ABH20_13235 [Geobacillus sp. T6]OXB85917.1 MFS transporter [Geobacillus thermocatenulatus]